ncbi:MAG: ComEC/Rec2 family competence protein, partial [Faecalibacterium sp.]|nr:ComEC/Rec2 family competence protein [Faecalibacterium sp.]
MPQTELFVPFAAFFVAVCLVLCIFDAARKAALCILLGAAVGMASVLHTANRLERIRVQYAGRPLMLTAEVESTADSYDPGIVDAVLHVEKVNGSAASFRVECSALPECKAGERVQGRFILSAPASGSRVSLYADGIALQAEMDEDGPELTVL